MADVIVHADPADAQVVLVGPPDVLLGRAEQVLHVPSDRSITLRIEHSGYEPRSFTVVLGVSPHPFSLPLEGPAVLHQRTPWQLLLIPLVLAALALRRRSRGEFLGRFRLLERLGEGGSATVYLAQAPREPSVVIKRLADNASPEMRERFRREAEEGAALRHPGLPAVLEAHDTWIVLEHVPGVPLRQRIDDGPMPLAEVVRVAQSLGETLTWLHQQGVIHRDLKPDNVMIGERVTLIDLGVARWVERSTVTATADAPGSLAYTAPELFRGTRGTAQSDQYSLGVMLYEMLTGARPYGDSANRMVMVKHHLYDAAPAAGLSPEMDAVLARMLAKPPEDRYPTLQEAIAALVDGAQHHGKRHRGEEDPQHETL